jgi:hypothetical protein
LPFGSFNEGKSAREQLNIVCLALVKELSLRVWETVNSKPGVGLLLHKTSVGERLPEGKEKATPIDDKPVAETVSYNTVLILFQKPKGKIKLHCRMSNHLGCLSAPNSVEQTSDSFDGYPHMT